MTDLPAAPPTATTPPLDQGRPDPAALLVRVQDKLQESLLRRLAGRQAIEKDRDIRVYHLYSWSHEVLLGLAAAGVSHPVLTAALPPAPASPPAGGTTSSTPVAASVLGTLSGYPWIVSVGLGTALILWIVLRSWVGWKKLQDRGPQILACARELGALEADLDAVLSKEDPLPDLSKLIARSKEIVDRYFKAGLWPWPVGPEGLRESTAAWAADLCKTYQGNWRAGGVA